MKPRAWRASGLMLAVLLARAAASADTIATLAFRWIAPAWFSISVGAALTALAVWSVLPRGRLFAAAVALIAVAWFTALHHWPMTPRKLFFRDMQRVEVGMSRGDVAELGARWRRTPHGQDLFGWPVGPDAEVWFHGLGGMLLSSDHCVIRYSGERVASIHPSFD